MKTFIARVSVGLLAVVSAFAAGAAVMKINRVNSANAGSVLPVVSAGSLVLTPSSSPAVSGRDGVVSVDLSVRPNPTGSGSVAPTAVQNKSQLSAVPTTTVVAPAAPAHYSVRGVQTDDDGAGDDR